MNCCPGCPATFAASLPYSGTHQAAMVKMRTELLESMGLISAEWRAPIRKRAAPVSIARMRFTPFCVCLTFVFALCEHGRSFGGESTPPSAASDAPSQDAIDECVRREMDSQQIPGLSLGVVRAGKLVMAKGYGKASLELDAPATPSTLYGLGSISKQFTAAAIMLLVEERRIGLDDPLTNYFSWAPKEWSEVRVRHLLTHTSGIRPEEWKGGIVEFDRFEHNQ